MNNSEVVSDLKYPEAVRRCHTDFKETYKEIEKQTHNLFFHNTMFPRPFSQIHQPVSMCELDSSISGFPYNGKCE